MFKKTFKLKFALPVIGHLITNYLENLHSSFKVVRICLAHSHHQIDKHPYGVNRKILLNCFWALTLAISSSSYYYYTVSYYVSSVSRKSITPEKYVLFTRFTRSTITREMNAQHLNHLTPCFYSSVWACGTS